jgi:hypothetical protein
MAVRKVKSRDQLIRPEQLSDRNSLIKAASIRSKCSILASDYDAFASDVSCIPRYKGDSAKSDGMA